MRTLIVVESQFGNTRLIAQAVASGLEGSGVIDVIGVDQAPAELPADLDLLIVGGPTHTFSMSREPTRADAHSDGAAGSTTGIREWLAALPAAASDIRFATFDTKMKHTKLTGSAARSAAHAGEGHGLHAEESMDFYVADKQGPLEEGELKRAAEWGRSLRR